MDISGIIILAALFVIWGVFLAFDLFQRNEKYGYFAYIVAVIPINYFWAIEYDPVNGPVIAFIILFILWDITLLRDTIGMALKKEKEIDDMVLFLAIGIIIQIIISAIIPEVNSDLQASTERFLYFWFPNIHSGIFSSSMVLLFKAAATLLVLLVIIPLILDIKDEEVPLPMFIIIIGIFILPFLYLSYIWLPDLMGVLTFLLSVILFVVLLIITKSGRETK